MNPEQGVVVMYNDVDLTSESYEGIATGKLQIRRFQPVQPPHSTFWQYKLYWKAFLGEVHCMSSNGCCADDGLERNHVVVSGLHSRGSFKPFTASYRASTTSVSSQEPGIHTVTMCMLSTVIYCTGGHGSLLIGRIHGAIVAATGRSDRRGDRRSDRDDRPVYTPYKSRRSCFRLRILAASTERTLVRYACEWSVNYRRCLAAYSHSSRLRPVRP